MAPKRKAKQLASETPSQAPKAYTTMVAVLWDESEDVKSVREADSVAHVRSWALGQDYCTPDNVKQALG